jgi:hypothetical protein
MQLKLNYIQVAIVAILEIICLFLPYLFLTGTALSINKNPFWLIFFITLICYSLIYLWYILLVEINLIGISERTIEMKNIITRKQRVMIII